MDPCRGEMVCPPPSIGWSALLLWTIALGAPRAAGAAVVAMLALASLCRAAAARAVRAELPPARVVR